MTPHLRLLLVVACLGVFARAHELRIDPTSEEILQRHFSGYGWSTAEARAKRGFVWVRKMEADLAFDWPAAEAVALEFEAAPFFQTGKRQVVGLFCNGSFIGQHTFQESPDEEVVRFTLPAAAVRAGANTLTFRVAYLDRPKGSDGRKLGMLLDWVSFKSRGSDQPIQQ